MRLDALRERRILQFDQSPHGRARLRAVMLTALTVGACSNAEPANQAARQPTLRVADAALVSGAPGLALRVADLTLARDPKNVRALIARGDALYAIGQHDQAEAAYRSAIAIDPTAAGAQVGLGRILVRTDPGAGEAAFVTALKYQPANVTALNNLGIARDLQGRYWDAEAAYYQALAVAPGSADVQVNLGLSLALSGHTEEAVRLLRGVAADPAAAQAWHKELTDALTLAGDGPWAQQNLRADAGPQVADAAPAADSVRFASAPAADAPAQPEARPPRPAPVTPVAQADLGAVMAMAATIPPVATMPGHAPVQAAAPHRAAAGPSAAPGDGPFVQLGSLNSEAEATSEWGHLSTRVADALSGRQPTITQAEVHGRTYWRIRTFGFASVDEARSLCGRLQAAALRCWWGR
jgi:Flp pilus assembly protein TadD